MNQEREERKDERHSKTAKRAKGITTDKTKKKMRGRNKRVT